MQHRRQNTRHASLMTLDSQPGQPSRNRGADRRVEPQGAPAGLAGIPDRDDLLRRIALRWASARAASALALAARRRSCGAERPRTLTCLAKL